MSSGQLEEHRRIWAQKPVLARVYAPWFAALLRSCPPAGRVLEVGAGPGFLADHARQERPDLAWIASDLAPTSWSSLAADAARLPLRDRACDAVVGLDVLHHLAQPERFLQEAARVLRDGGRLALVEPWITPLSWVVYRFFHQEDCCLAVDPRDPFPPGKQPFAGNAALPWRIAARTASPAWERLGFAPPRVHIWNTFAYLLSLGFRRASLLPPALVDPLMALDARLSRLAPLCGLRAELVFERLARRQDASR